mmetsp:Transcript_61427/g.139061  ORF Transcript_61427/g.139061 Transcript_61427/m.139061 type:complete len:267 (-) Transcript_61427:400-1200(-)
MQPVRTQRLLPRLRRGQPGGVRLGGDAGGAAGPGEPRRRGRLRHGRGRPQPLRQTHPRLWQRQERGVEQRGVAGAPGGDRGAAHGGGAGGRQGARQVGRGARGKSPQRAPGRAADWAERRGRGGHPGAAADGARRDDQLRDPYPRRARERLRGGPRDGAAHPHVDRAEGHGQAHLPGPARPDRRRRATVGPDFSRKRDQGGGGRGLATARFGHEVDECGGPRIVPLRRPPRPQHQVARRLRPQTGPGGSAIEWGRGSGGVLPDAHG